MSPASRPLTPATERSTSRDFSRSNMTLRVAWILALCFSLCPAADQTYDYKKVPLGMMPIIWPRDNPYSAQRAYLGRLLFFDTRISRDGAVACSNCHNPKLAFTDGSAVSTGVKGQKGLRSAPT